MQKNFLIVCLLFVCSCRQDTKTGPLKISGQYVVGGFKVKNDIEKNTKELISATGNANYAFNFINDEALQIVPKLGMEYFSDSVFQYRLTDKTLYLLGKNNEYIIPYTRNGGILNLYVNKKGIDTLQIMPLR